MSNIPNNFYRTSVKALILDENKKFLLLKEENGLWELPGGGLDFGEKPHACIIRELKEELNVETTYVASQPSYFVTGLNSNGQQWKSNILYETKVKDLNFKPSSECVELRFFTKEEASEQNLYPVVKEFLKEFNPDNHK